MNKLKKLFLTELADRYDSEKRLVPAMAKMAKAATCKHLEKVGGSFRPCCCVCGADSRKSRQLAAKFRLCGRHIAANSLPHFAGICRAVLRHPFTQRFRWEMVSSFSIDFSRLRFHHFLW